VFHEQAEAIMPTGTAGQTIWVGTEEDRKILRVDVDIDAGRAALRWMSDGAHAVELPVGHPLSVLERMGREPVTIPAELTRVSPATARAAVAEFVATGRRPTCVTWKA
jgi:Immunity protein Imm1